MLILGKEGCGRGHTVIKVLNGVVDISLCKHENFEIYFHFFYEQLTVESIKNWSNVFIYVFLVTVNPFNLAPFNFKCFDAKHISVHFIKRKWNRSNTFIIMTLA